MKNTIVKWSLICFGLIILAFILTNPSNTAYTEYLVSKGYRLESSKVQISSPNFEYTRDEYECKPFWGRINSFLILSTFEYQNDSVFMLPEKPVIKTMTHQEQEEAKAYNAKRLVRFFHITKKHMGMLTKFSESKSKVEEFKVD